jgi:hypothetical protein
VERKEFILAYVGEGAKPLSDVARIRKQPDVEVLSDTESESSLLVKAEQPVIDALLRDLSAWRAFENRKHKVKLGVGFGGKRSVARS